MAKVANWKRKTSNFMLNGIDDPKLHKVFVEWGRGRDECQTAYISTSNVIRLARQRDDAAQAMAHCLQAISSECPNEKFRTSDEIADWA